MEELYMLKKKTLNDIEMSIILNKNQILSDQLDNFDDLLIYTED